MLNRFFLKSRFFFFIVVSAFSPFQTFPVNLQYLIDRLVFFFLKKKPSIFSRHKNFVVCLESERNETVVLSSGSSKRGWEILDPQNYSIQQRFITRSFQSLELF